MYFIMSLVMYGINFVVPLQSNNVNNTSQVGLPYISYQLPEMAVRVDVAFKVSGSGDPSK
jgi:hypothetical protein